MIEPIKAKVDPNAFGKPFDIMKVDPPDNFKETMELMKELDKVLVKKYGHRDLCSCLCDKQGLKHDCEKCRELMYKEFKIELPNCKHDQLICGDHIACKPIN